MSYNVHVSTLVKTSADLAFQAFSAPEPLNRWFTTEAKIDLIAGG